MALTIHAHTLVQKDKCKKLQENTKLIINPTHTPIHMAQLTNSPAISEYEETQSLSFSNKEDWVKIIVIPMQDMIFKNIFNTPSVFLFY